MRIRNILIITSLVVYSFNCSGNTPVPIGNNDNDLFKGFVNPPAQSRPFVRWWWNGNHVAADEIKRELDLLAAAGIGGVEINPIALPKQAVDIGTKPLEWLSNEWNQLVALAAKEAKQKGMIADLLVGTGWPFGGEFLTEDEILQQVIIHKIQYPAGTKIEEDIESLYKKALAVQRKRAPAKIYEMHFIKLVPKSVSDTLGIIDLSNKVINNQLRYEIPPGDYELVYGILHKGQVNVSHGAPGGAGPVMNHFDKTVALKYLNQIKKISDDTGIPLDELIRALFCDSIELSGSNWTSGFTDIFYQTYHYHLEPYYPFVFYDPYKGYPEENFTPEFEDELKRVRYDYNKLLTKLYRDNFVNVFQDFCKRNNVKCRFQAYGWPVIMGLLEGYMIPDIPEGNTWIYAPNMNMNANEWNWDQPKGYIIWNLYAASAAHLTGKQVISSESMTNTAGVFKTSLAEIKQHDDMNFITGINHTVLHGFNYSPPEAGFPGWTMYGTYFSEHNTWWPYFPKWVEYNARLSHVFQQSQPVKNIAVLIPEGDIWSDHGLYREPFHTEPWYGHRLWEPLSQIGSSCDYISENIIREGHKKNKGLIFGQASYQTILLSSVRSLLPETALSLLEFVQNGGRLVAIDGVPSRSLSHENTIGNNASVQRVFRELKTKYPNQFLEIDSPINEDDLLSWTVELFKKINLQTNVEIDTPNKAVYQMHKRAGKKDIWFFTNTSKVATSTFNAIFSTGDKTPWLWNPEEGTRSVYPYGNDKNKLNITLKPLQSLLLVFEPEMDAQPEKKEEKTGDETTYVIKDEWIATFEHMNGQVFERKFNKLEDFGTSTDEKLNTFAGTVTYKTVFNVDKKLKSLELDNVNKGVTEVFLNGIRIGINWYGKPIFNIEKAIIHGDNVLEIKYTSVLSNYVMSLENDPTAERWTKGYNKIPMGIEGYVTLTSN